MAEEEQTYRFKRKLREISIELENPDTDLPEKYVIKELGGDARADYFNAIRARMSGDEIKDFRGLEALLLTRTFFERTPDDGDVVVSGEFVGTLPSSTLVELMKLSTTLSGIDPKTEKDEDDEDSAKNE